MSQPSTFEEEQQSSVTEPDGEHEEFDPEEEPVGTLAILSVYLILIVGLWIAVYVTLIQRS